MELSLHSDSSHDQGLHISHLRVKANIVVASNIIYDLIYTALGIVKLKVFSRFDFGEE